MKIKAVYIILFTFFLNTDFYAQIFRVEEVKTEANKLKKAISTDDTQLEAESYVNLADGYFNDGNFQKSEEFYQKAKTIYEKSRDKKNLSLVTRKLAQSQEKQNKISTASQNYESASKIGYSKAEMEVNSNDASRLRSSNLDEKEKAVQQNIAINNRFANKTELSNDYTNLAEVNIQQKNIPKATENLNNAYYISKENAPQQALQINQQIADLYVENKNFDKAISVKKQVLGEDFVQKNSKEKINQIQQLAEIYLKNNDKNNAENLLENAYKIAIEKGHTLEAQKSILKLDSLYKSDGNTSKSIVLYQDFLGKLPLLLSKDQSLVDEKIMKETEDKIAQLEKEKSLQDELIRKKNIFNYSLIGSLVLLLGLVAFILFTLKKLKIKNKKIALQSLRREMNPHFIFNSLNSVNQFIATNNELEANQYLTKFSKLMRGVMENSAHDFIPLYEELELLKNYLGLEKSRFQEKFNYEILIDELLDFQNLQIPVMLIQPFLENAIWHGLRYKTEMGLLKLNFKKFENQLIVTIEDNGIGIEDSKKQKTEHQKNRKGRGMKNTLERIKLLNDLYGKNIKCEVLDKEKGGGVLVTLKMNF